MNQMVSPFDIPQAAPVPVSGQVAFTGERSDFRRLVTRGAFLELITVGFYRFWLATDMRRHLWVNTSVDGDAAEYTGTAKELLIGFLFALAILAPIYLAYFLIGLEAERIKAFASVPLGLFFYVFAQFAIYRARRYRLTRTVWRGVRFSMTGSGLGYAWRAGLWALAAFCSLGIALPWAKVSLERYKMRHTAYGDLQGRFEGSGGELFKRTWWRWLLLWPSMIIIVPVPFLYASLKAIEWRWWIEGVRMGEVGFESSLARNGLTGLYWKVIGWSMLLMIALGAWAGFVFWTGYSMVSSSLPAEERFIMVTQQLPVMLGFFAGYIALALVAGIVMRMYLVRDVWQRVAQSIVVRNLSAADNVTAQGQLVGAIGEGFADSLDVVGF